MKRTRVLLIIYDSRISCPEFINKKIFLKNIAKIHKKHLCRSLFDNKVCWLFL